MSSNCIVCESMNVVSINTTNTKYLTKQYKKQLNINLDNYYKNTKTLKTLMCQDCDLVFYSPHLGAPSEE